MAKYLTGTATGPGAGDAWVQAVIAQAVANGWTSHDVISSASGTRDVVLRGSALDATADVRPFGRITQTSTTNVNFSVYSDWDATTHAGINQAGADAFTVQDASFSYVIYADPFAICPCAKISSAWNHNYVGYLRRGLTAAKSGITKTTSGYSAGATALNVASDMTGKLQVGQKIWIMNYAHSSASANAARAELVTVTAIAAGVLTVSALAGNYDTAAVLGANVCPNAVSTSSSGVNIGGTLHSSFNPDANRGAGATSQTSTTSAIILQGTTTSISPESNTLEYGSGIFSITSNVASHLGFRGYARGYISAASGVSIEDVHDDGAYTYLILNPSTSGGLCIGPREV